MAQDTVSLEQIVTDFVFSIDSDDYVNNVSDTMVRNLALRGIRDLGFDIMKRIKAANLNVSATNTVTLPADYVDLLKIGIVGEDGLVYVFGENKNKNLLANNAGDLPDYLLGYSDFIYRNFVNSTTDGRLYGYGGGHYSGEYRINLGENRIELTLGTGTDTVYIEYIADEALLQILLFTYTQSRLFVHTSTTTLWSVRAMFQQWKRLVHVKSIIMSVVWLMLV
jgi:hypothetical protein